jgi:predicted porin
LEKIEMKKTLVAVAAMAVVTGAMANVTIGGLVDQAVSSAKATTAAGVTTTTKSIAPVVNGASELFFTGSEDLGDGLKASFRLGLNMTADDGPLSVAYGAGKSTASATSTSGFVTSVAATNLGSLTINSSVLNSTATNVAYDLGMVKVNAYTATTKLAGTTSQHKGSGFGLSIPVNASTRLAVFSSGATGTNGSGTQEKEKGTKYAVFHNLSKRTMAYGFVGKSSTSGALNATGQTAFGLMHSF